jgi:hypothetical protein
MKDEPEITPEAEGLHNPPAKNDGPDETPVHEDLYHDEGRRNLLDKEGRMKPGAMDALPEKGDDL